MFVLFGRMLLFDQKYFRLLSRCKCLIKSFLLFFYDLILLLFVLGTAKHKKEICTNLEKLNGDSSRII